MRRLVALFVVLAAACADPSVEYPSPPELVLGAGRDELTPIANGDAVPIVIGLQGGTVVWGAASARYVDPDQLELRFSITPPTGAASLSRMLVDLADADDGFALAVTLGHQVFLPDADEFSGKPCVWRLEARDREGRMAFDEKTVIPTRAELP